MAEKKLRAAIHVARKTFLIDGNHWVRQGDTAVAGHPVMKAHPDAFEPWKPTFGELEVVDADKPSGLEAYAALAAKAKELGIPATGKAVDLEAAIAAAEAAVAAKAEADAKATAGGDS